jgi:hypothetical protein
MSSGINSVAFLKTFLASTSAVFASVLSATSDVKVYCIEVKE